MLDGALVIGKVILNGLFLPYVRMQHLWRNIYWKPSLNLPLIGQHWDMCCGNLNILLASSNKMVAGTTTTVSSPLSSTKGRSQYPCWANLVLFPLIPTTHAFTGRNVFIIDGSVNIIQENIISIPTSTEMVSKDTLILWYRCDFNATFAYTATGIYFSKCEHTADLRCLILIFLGLHWLLCGKLPLLLPWFGVNRNTWFHHM